MNNTQVISQSQLGADPPHLRAAREKGQGFHLKAEVRAVWERRQRLYRLAAVHRSSGSGEQRYGVAASATTQFIADDFFPLLVSPSRCLRATG